MTVKEQLAERDVTVRRFEYEDRTVLAADFGPHDDASVDVVGDTVIVVADDEQYELEVEGDTDVFMKNGILSIEVNA